MSLIPQDSKWYYLEEGNTVGPVLPVEVESLIKSGKITKNTSVWYGEGDWRPAQDTLLSPLFTKPTDYGKMLLAIPIIGLIPILFLGALGTILIILATAIVAALEAKKAGMKTNRKNGTYGPTAWFFTFLLLWIVGYPTYMYKRKYFGLHNRLGASIIVMVLFFVGSSLIGVIQGANLADGYPDESVAIDNLLSVVRAQSAYAADNQGYTGSFKNLYPDYLDANLSEPMAGYRYSIKGAGKTWNSLYDNFECVAVPMISGFRGFFIDASGVVRFTSDGSEHTSKSPSL